MVARRAQCQGDIAGVAHQMADVAALRGLGHFVSSSSFSRKIYVSGSVAVRRFQSVALVEHRRGEQDLSQGECATRQASSTIG